MFQRAELSFDRCSSPVEVTPALRLAGDQRVQAVGFDPDGLRRTLAGGAAPLGRARLVRNGWHALSPTLHLAVWGKTEDEAPAAFKEAVERDEEILSRPALGVEDSDK
jgi:hypothetical protein